MALARLKTWISGEVLTASDLNAEFNNIINNLLVALSGTIVDGTASNPGLQFASDANTGLYRIGTDAAGFSANGLQVWEASEFFRASAFLFPATVATETARTGMPGRAYWQTTENALHIHAGSLIARVPALTGMQAGDLIIASNASGVSGATIYARVQRPPAEHSRLAFATATKLTLASGYIPLKVGGAWVRRDLHTAVELLSPSVASNTLYYIYATDSSGATTLEASTTAHVSATQHGVRVKSGDETRTLVGVAFAHTAGAFVDGTRQRLVNTWFNRRVRVASGEFSTNRATTSTSLTELNTEIRNEFHLWGDECLSIGFGASVAPALPDAASTGISIDGTPEGPVVYADRSATSGVYHAIGFSYAKQGLAEGTHYVTLVGLSESGGSATWASEEIARRKVVLSTNIR